MKEMQKQFLDLLFEPNETICVTSGSYGAHSIEQSQLGPEIPLRTPERNFMIYDSDIQLVGINPIKGFKRDENVTAYRNFMLEFDDGPLVKQLEYIKESGIPYSAIVYSGNKSMHVVIALTQGYSETIWRYTTQWILNILKAADQQNKSPSRGVRFPGNRRKNGARKMQKMIEFNGKITQTELNNWLSKHLDKKPKIEQPQIENYGKIISEANLPVWLVQILKKLQNGELPERNKNWFKVASYLAKNGAPMQNTISICDTYFVEENDFDRRELMSCIKSAYKSRSK